MYNYLFPALIAPLLMVVNINNKAANEITNYYGIPIDLTFNNVKHKLSWSTHPNDAYYKQEYVANGESAERFNNMVLIDFLITDLSVKEVAGAQLETLNERKRTDDICNFQVLKDEKRGEYIVDFVISEKSDNSLAIVEWNGYRYKPYIDKAGHKGVLLFGVSRRAYNEKGREFLKVLRGYKTDILNKLSTYSIPDIQLTK